MGNSQKRTEQIEIDPARWGVSFSLKQCLNFDIDQTKALTFLIEEMGFRRFRLMSYWDEHEKNPGEYDFSKLDEQVEIIEKAGGIVTFCLGARQPRWPENHWPDWAWEADKTARSEALLNYIEVVVSRYRNRDCIVGWQLENEALLKGFGKRSEIDRARLVREFQLIKKFDKTRPILMSTSTSWGIPLRKPIPDVVGFSYYHTYWDNSDKSYHNAFGHYSSLHRFRAFLIKLIWRRPSAIHELQCEPWGPADIWEMPIKEQDNSMSAEKIVRSIELAKKTRLYPVDLWGGEWWYWRYQKLHDDSIYKTVLSQLNA